MDTPECEAEAIDALQRPRSKEHAVWSFVGLTRFDTETPERLSGSRTLSFGSDGPDGVLTRSVVLADSETAVGDGAEEADSVGGRPEQPTPCT